MTKNGSFLPFIIELNIYLILISVKLTGNKPSMAQKSLKKAWTAALSPYFCIAACGFAWNSAMACTKLGS